MYYQKGSASYNRQWRNGGVGRTRRIANDKRLNYTWPWLVDRFVKAVTA